MDNSDSRLRILLVEDCRDTAESLHLLLELWGHKVWIARNGLAAISLASTLRPHVALIDIGLPGPDGFEVARRLRHASGQMVPLLVAATGYEGKAIRRHAWEVGFDHFLTKPLNLTQLQSILSASHAGAVS